MPNRARAVTPGTLQHIVMPFVDRGWYLTSNRERSYYLALVGRALLVSDWRCLAYFAMNNRLRLAMIAGELAFNSLAKRMNVPFAQWLNKQRGRKGQVFARPMLAEIPSNRTLELIAAIHNEPVRAGKSSRAVDCAWSSHRSYVGAAPAPQWLHVAEGLHRAGFDAPNAFDAAVNALAIQAPPQVATPRERVSRAPLAAPRSDVVIRVVAEQFQLTPESLSVRHARGTVSEAKQTAVLAARAVGVPLAQIAEALQVTRQRASRIAMDTLPDEGRTRLAEIVRALRESVDEAG